MDHFIKKCEFGHNHGQCRCMSKDKKVILVECDRKSDYEPKHKKDV